MSFPRTILSAMLLLCVACPLRAYAVPPGPDDNRAQVSKLVDQAEAAVGKGNRQAAYDAYVAAWALQKSFDIAGNAGSLALKLGKLPEAARYLSYSVQSFPPTGDPAQLALLKEKQAKALQGVGRVRVHLSVPGAALTLDGAAVAPEETGADLFVSPGTHALVATADGYVEARATVDATAGSSQEVALTLVRSVPMRSGPPRALLIAGGVLAAGGLAAGVGLTVAANGKRADVNALGMTVGLGPACVGTAAASANCQTLKNDAVSHDTLNKAALGSFIVAGAVALATAGLGVWSTMGPKDATDKKTSLRVAPALGRGEAGVMIVGVW